MKMETFRKRFDVEDWSDELLLKIIFWIAPAKNGNFYHITLNRKKTELIAKLIKIDNKLH
jgi:hypothetical protein